MPVVYPVYTLPEPRPEESLDSWVRRANDVYGRNLQEAEARPVVSYAQATTAGLALSTTPTLVPGMQVTVAVPGGAIVNVVAFVDFLGQTSAGALTGELFDQPPGTTLSTAASPQIVFGPGVSTGTRGTVGQSWTDTAPVPGVHVYEIRASRGGTVAGSVPNGGHATLQVTVL